MHRSIYAAVALLPASASPLLAQEEKGGLLTLHPGLSIWTLVIFLIVFGVLYWKAFPALLGAVEARERHLAELAEAAERDRAEAAALADEQRRLVEETRARVQEALNESRSTAERMRAELIEQAQKERADLLARTHAELAAERASTIEAVRRDAVDVAMAAAERLVRKNLDSADNRRLVEEYLGVVGTPAAARA